MRLALLAVLTLPGLAPRLSLIQAQIAQAAQAETLRDTVLALDKDLFDAFDNCDLERWKSYLAEEIEFYQDNDDVTTTRTELEASFKDRCGRDNLTTLRRELLPETVEVHSIQGYGAVQFGTHRFWTVTNGEADQLAATPQFVHLWRNQDGAWQITHVISYAH